MRRRRASGSEQDEVEHRVGDGEDAVEEGAPGRRHRAEDGQRHERRDRAHGPPGCAARSASGADGEAGLPVRVEEHEEGRDQEGVGQDEEDVGDRGERRLVPHHLEGRQAELAGEVREEAEREEEPGRARGVAPPPAGRGRRRQRPLRPAGRRASGGRPGPAGGAGSAGPSRGRSPGRGPSPRRSPPRHPGRPRARSRTDGRRSSRSLPGGERLPRLGHDRRRLVAPEEDVEAAAELAEQGSSCSELTAPPAMPSF